MDNNWQEIISKKKNDKDNKNKEKKNGVLRPISARNIQNKNEVQK